MDYYCLTLLFWFLFIQEIYGEPTRINVTLGGEERLAFSFNESITQISVVDLLKDGMVVFSINTVDKNKTQMDERVSLLSSNADTMTFNLRNISRVDNGHFQCRVRRINQTVEFATPTYILRVLEPPQITITYTEGKIYKGDSVSLLCQATGRPFPDVRWLVSRSNNSLLNFTFNEIQNKTLECFANNTAGNVTKKISFHVQDNRPSLPLHVGVFKKTDPVDDNKYSLTLKWNASETYGKSEILYYRVRMIPDDGTSVTVREKTYTNLDVFEMYNFSVEACNEFGCGAPAFHPYRFIDKSVETNLTVEPMSSRSIFVKFASPSQSITSFKACTKSCDSCGSDTCGDAVKTCLQLPSDTRSKEIRNLSPYTRYRVSGFYTYTVTSGNYTLETEVKCVETIIEASEPAKNVEVNYIDDHYSRLNISWERPGKLHSEFVDYNITYGYSDNKKTVPTNLRTKQRDEKDKRYHYVIRDLKAYTNYSISVVVITNGTLTLSSATGQDKYIQTDETAPTPPELQPISVSSPTSATARWKAPQSSPPVTGYRVTLSSNSNDQDGNEQVKHITKTEFTWTTLKADTNYTVKVKAYLIPQRQSEKWLWSNLSRSHFKTKKPNIVKKSHTLIIVTVVMLFLVVIFLIASLCYCRRKDLFKSSYNSNFYMPAGFTQETEFQPIPFSLRQSFRTAEAKRVPMTLEEFEHHVAELHSNSDYLFSEEYASLGPRHPEGTEVTFENSHIEANRNKNRYQDIVAYDQTRVRLMSLEGIVGSNYINANFVDGYHRPCAYIATQGPLTHTLSDFWRMVWETKSRVIVMLTNLNERGRKKCDQYWPSSGTESYKNYTVTLEKSLCYANYIIRKLRVIRVKRNAEALETLSEPGEERIVWQYHYTEWPDFGVPQDRRMVLEFILHCRQHEEDHPPIIHCSAGVGRTGTYVMVDTLMRRYDDRKNVEVFNTLKKLRKQRNCLVQQEIQYIFIHDTVLDYMKSGVTQIAVDELETTINQDHLPELVEEQWKLLDNFTVPKHFCSSGQRPCNRPKNRQQEIIPVDNRRVRLLVQAAAEGSDYINASYIDSFHSRTAYIVTQNPLKTTIADFWRMVWETNSLIIVNLMENDEVEEDGESYIPLNEAEATHGYFHIQIDEERVENNYICRAINLTNKNIKDDDGNKRQIHQYHFSSWPLDFYPRMAFLFELLVDVAQCQKKVRHLYPRRKSFIQIRELDPPMVLHCKYGVGRSGMFAALLCLKEQIEDSYANVDVFTTVHTLMSQRPSLLQNVGQYDYLFKAVLSLKHYINKNKPTPLTMDL